MDYKELNTFLKDLQNVDDKQLTFISKNPIHLGVSGSNHNYEGVQGEEDNYYNIYKIKSEDNLYLQVEYYTDSYGSNDAIRGVQFVVPKEKPVTVYEPIK